MKIIEVRDGFIKFEADKSVYLSSFVKIDGEDKSYAAQVCRIQKIGTAYIASAKMMFLIEGNSVKEYDRTEPSADSEIYYLPYEFIQKNICLNQPVITGKTPNNENIASDISAFNQRMLISIDSAELNNLLINNLSKQFNNLKKNTLILDTLGIIKGTKYIAGVDFKLPLNTITLQFLYESCLNDTTNESKLTIAEIFKDLSDYSETTPFLPFATLKTIVDDMVDKQHIFKLLVLKNKLNRLDKLGYFASTQNEAESLQKIIKNSNTVIDLSKIDILFQNCFINYIYQNIEGENLQAFVELSNNVSKKSLKTILSDSDIKSTVITHSNYKYLNDMKELFNNFIIESTPNNNKIFRTQYPFLSTMQKENYLVFGTDFNNISIVAEAKQIDEFLQPDINNSPDTTESELGTSLGEENEILQAIPKEELISSINEKSSDAIEAVTNEVQEEFSEEPFSNIEDPYEEADGYDDFSSIESDNEETETYEENNTVNSAESIIAEEDFQDNLEEDLQETEGKLSEELPDNNEILNEIALEENSSEYTEAEEEIEVLTEENIKKSEPVLTENDTIQLNETDELSVSDDEINLINDDLSQEDVITEVTEAIPNVELDTSFSEPQIASTRDLSENNDFDEIVELDSEDANEDDIIIDINDDVNDNITIDEDLDEQIIKDVDRVYTTVKNDSLEEISDSDLDFIDELNEDNELLDDAVEIPEEIPEYTGIGDDILEQPQESIIPNKTDSEILEQRESSTPIVPVYDADIPQEDMVVSDPIQQGDSVVHAKYGNGVVEKMIKYGNKTLFSINFENIGRRLLDPTLTEIKKL